MAAMDRVFNQMKGKHQEGADLPPDCLARFLCTKSSWRGKYRRILSITPVSVVTQYPDTLAITNVWQFTLDSDIDAISAAASDAEEPEFTISARTEKRGKFKAQKFSCKHRSTLLSLLYQAIAAAALHSHSSMASKMLGSPDIYSAYKMRQGKWVPVQLRMSSLAVDRLDAAGQVRWRLEYRHMAKPAARLLQSGESDPVGVFALLGKVGRVPRVYACRDRDAFLRAMQTAAFKRMGLSLAVDTQAGVSGHALLEAVAAAEREVAASASQEPLGEWECVRVRPAFGLAASPAAEALSTPADAAAALQEPEGGGRKRGVARRVVLTASAILERRTATYEVAERHPLAAIAALVRFADQPLWLGIEWADGTPVSIFILPARDALLAATLDTAQAAAGRCIPVLAQPTLSGDVIIAGGPGGGLVGLAPPPLGDRELERLCLGHLSAAARAAFAGLADAPVSQSPEEGRSTDGDESDAMSVGSPPEGLLRRKGGLAAAFGRHSTEGRMPALRSSLLTSPHSQELIAELRKRVAEFNACTAYTGLPAGPKLEEGLVAALLSLLPLPLPASAAISPGAGEAAALVAVLHCLQRLASSPSGASAVTSIPGTPARICAVLTQGHDHVASEGARLMYRLWSPACARSGQPPWQLPVAPGGSFPANSDSPRAVSSPQDDASASIAKSTILSQAGRCTALLGLLRGAGAGATLGPMAATEALAACVCPPGARSTDPILLHALLAEAAALGRPLFSLFSHPARSVLDGTALIMQAIAEGGPSAAAPMREAALAEGAILLHLCLAMVPKGGARAKLSRDLVALWADGYGPAMDLLTRVFPPGLLRYLSHPQPAAPSPPPLRRAAQPPAADTSPEAGTPTHPSQLRHDNGADMSQRQGALSPASRAQRSTASPLSPVSSPPRRDPTGAESSIPRRDGGSPPGGADSAAGARLRPGSAATPRASGRRGNWEAFWTQVDRDHCHAGLIWNERTRSELRDALQAEEAALAAGRARTASKSRHTACAWNHAEFCVSYPSLARELCVGNIYIKLLLEGLDQGAVRKLPVPKELFQALYRHFLRLADADLRLDPSLQHSAGMTSFASGDAEADRLLCVRALTAVYHEHAAAIGHFDGMSHAVALMDRTSNAELREGLLNLVHALLVPASAATSDAAHRVAALNGAAFVRTGGVQLAVDLVAGAHAAQERVQAPLQSNMLAYSSHRTEVKEWFHYPGQAASTRPRDTSIEDGQEGPLSRDEIKRGYAQRQIDMTRLFWSAGMLQPLPLGSIRELRWLVASRAGQMGPFARAEAALQVLLALAQLQPATEATGQVLQPLPTVHRQLASPSCLPHLAQVVLTGQPALVSLTGALLEIIVGHNTDALARLPFTGIFFFALAYCGSNLVELARLFHVAHLQTGQTGGATAVGGSSSKSGGQLAQRSVLGALLPESLLYVLTSSGPGAFAAALVADSDTPELIWTHRMRAQILVPQMYQHMGDLPGRLPQHNTLVYEHVACPPLTYPELQDEMWCHRYYLRNLCDTDRFPEWPVVDHVPLLQALLDEWRAEVARKPLAMSETQACQVLGISPGPDGTMSEEDLKSAYRALARKYHPDRNPAGREQFQAVAQAYERLQAGAAGGQGPQAWRLLLLLKAQCILYRRYPGVLEPFKYAGYPLLLQAVTLPEAEEGQEHAQAKRPPSKPPHAHWLAAENVPQLQAALELCWLTCVSSQLNGEELARAGGVGTLGHLLSRCAAVLPVDAAPHVPAAIIATHALRTFAGMAAFAHARSELLARPMLVSDIVRACALERAASAVDAALQAVMQMCAMPELQTQLLQEGVLGYLVPLLLAYDSTLGEDSAGEEAATAQLLAGESSEGADSKVATYLGLSMQRSNMQAARNLHAVLAARALGCLAGVVPSVRATPQNTPAQEALSRLLTPPLAIRLCDADPRPLLSQLATSISSPQVVWNSKMREQLLAQMEAARSDSTAVLPPAEFQYTSIQGELVVAGVFVRIYNEQPAFALSDPAAFAKGLVSWVHAHAGASLGPDAQRKATLNGVEQGMDEEQVDRQRGHLASALTALHHVVEAHPRLSALLAAKPALAPLLTCLQPICRRMHKPLDMTGAEDRSGLQLLAEQQRSRPSQVEHEAEAAALALAVLVRLTAHAGCVEALAEERAALLGLWLVHRPPTATLQMLALRLLHALAGTPAAAWAAAAQGGAVYLLSVLLPAASTPVFKKEVAGSVRAAAAVLLGRMMGQPLHGPRVVLLLGNLLPLALVAAIQEGPGEVAVAAVEQPSETPERVWTPHMASTTADEVAHLASAARSNQAQGSLQWSLPDGYRLQFDALANELYVGGVYVRLFLKNPKFPLHAPKAFMEGLVESYVASAKKPDNADAALVLAAAAVELLRAHPLLADHAVSLGYTNALMKLLSGRLSATPQAGGQSVRAPDELGGSALRLLHQLALSVAGAESLARSSPPPVPTLLQAGKVWGLAGSVLALETLQRALQPGNRARSVLVGAALQAGLVPALLAKLDWRSHTQQGPPENKEGDEAVERVVAIEVLHLLAAEGVHAAAVQELLVQSDIWRRYKDQQHDLFLPAGSSESQGGVVALLKGSEAMRFALPAPELPSAHRDSQAHTTSAGSWPGSPLTSTAQAPDRHPRSPAAAAQPADATQPSAHAALQQQYDLDNPEQSDSNRRPAAQAERDGQVSHATPASALQPSEEQAASCPDPPQPQESQLRQGAQPDSQPEQPGDAESATDRPQVSAPEPVPGSGPAEKMSLPAPPATDAEAPSREAAGHDWQSEAAEDSIAQVETSAVPDSQHALTSSEAVAQPESRRPQDEGDPASEPRSTLAASPQQLSKPTHSKSDSPTQLQVHASASAMQSPNDRPSSPSTPKSQDGQSSPPSSSTVTQPKQAEPSSSAAVSPAKQPAHAAAVPVEPQPQSVPAAEPPTATAASSNPLSQPPNSRREHASQPPAAPPESTPPSLPLHPTGHTTSPTADATRRMSSTSSSPLQTGRQSAAASPPLPTSSRASAADGGRGSTPGKAATQQAAADARAKAAAGGPAAAKPPARSSSQKQDGALQRSNVDDNPLGPLG